MEQVLLPSESYLAGVGRNICLILPGGGGEFCFSTSNAKTAKAAKNQLHDSLERNDAKQRQ